MSKKMLVIPTIIIIAAIGASVAYFSFSSRRLSPKETSTYSNNGLDITVDYFRPSKRGRLIFGYEKDGALLPNGKYWRMGANDATEISFSKDVLFAGQSIKAGRYRMYANLDELSWKISLNSEVGAYGATEPKYDLDIAKVDLPVEKLPSVTEQFTISFEPDTQGVQMRLAWDQTQVVAPIRLQ